jgi:iron complex transport system ATP-binding protein
MPVLKVRDLCYHTGERQILSNISCELGEGELVGLVGANGAGKTTLLRVLMGLLTASSGDVWIQKMPLHRYSPRSLARRITLVPQDTGIAYPFAVRDLVAMGRHPHLRRFVPMTTTDRAIVDNAMRSLEVLAMADRPVTALSGGEKQRVLIARALAQQTPVILLDEATASLDLCHQLDVLNAAKKLAQKGHMVIAAIHDLTMASRFCSRLLMMSKGQLVANGNPAEVLTQASLREHFTVSASIRPSEEVAGLTVTPLYSLA